MPPDSEQKTSLLTDAQLRRLLDVGRGLVAELEPETVLRRVLDVARELTGARYAALGVLDETRTGLERFLTSGIDPATHRAIGDLPHGRGVLGVLIDDPRPLRLSEVGRHPRSYGFPPGHPPMRSFLGVPVVVRGEAFGNLYLTEKAGGEQFTDADQEAICALADWAAIAIANARSYTLEHGRRTELERAVEALEATTDIARALGGETDLGRVLELVVKRARALVDARCTLISLVGETGDHVEVAALAGDADRALVGRRVPLEGSVSGHVVATRRTERLGDVSARLHFVMRDALDVRTGIFVPLVFRGRALGVLASFDRAGGEEFAAGDERLLESFAASAATAVATAQDVVAKTLRRGIEASERERARWARELHDETLQELGGLRLALSATSRSEAAAPVREPLAAAVDQIDLTITGLRQLITELRPAALDRMGVEPALRSLVQRVTATSGLEVELASSLAFEAGRADTRLTPPVEETVYRVVQEALTNAVKHSGAEHVSVRIDERQGVVTLEVADDGSGFETERPAEGFGLLGMAERVSGAEGQLDLESSPGGGTTVRGRLPARHRPPETGGGGTGDVSVATG